MNLGQSIRRGVKWLLLGNLGGQFLQFVFGVVLARLLVPRDFGMIVTIQVFTGVVGLLATGGMGQSLVRAKHANTDDFNAVFTLQLALGILIYLGFFLSAPWIARYFDNPLYADLLRVSALSFMLRPFSLIRVSWLNREMEFKKRSLVDLTSGTLMGISSVMMAAAGMGVWSLTLSGLVGALVSNILLSRATPLRLRLSFQMATVGKHSVYGFKITASDVLKHLKEQLINLILSKAAGPDFLGLFSKAESLARMPNRLITPPTSQAVFRAMSKVQDDLDQTKYMFYRTISLLIVYILPLLVGLWWVAEPFIRVVYGEKWVPVAEPLRIIVLAGFFRMIMIPCGVVLAAQNRMTQEVIAEGAGLIFGLAACLIGLNWGLQGVAWALVASTIFYTAYVYALVYRTIPTRLADLFAAIRPGLFLNVVLFAVLTFVDNLVVDLMLAAPLFYLGVMAVFGFLTYALAFLFLPISALRSEVARWRERINGGLSLVSKGFTS